MGSSGTMTDVSDRAAAVILDLDDTLFDHRTSARRGAARLITELGATPERAILDAWESGAEQLMARRRTGELDRDGYRRERVRHLFRAFGRESESLDDDRCDRHYARFLALYEESWVAFDDALPVLRALEERSIPVAVLTNGPEERQQRKVRRLGLAPWVVGVWTSEHLAAKKPEARTYLTVCAALGAEPATVLHAGDDRECDLDGALAAGLSSLHLDRRCVLPDAPYRIRGLEELLTRV